MTTIKNYLFKFFADHPTLKRYLLSSLSTFLTIFCGVLAANLKGLDTGSHLTLSLILGFVGVALRAAFKGVIEWAAQQHADLPEG